MRKKKTESGNRRVRKQGGNQRNFQRVIEGVLRVKVEEVHLDSDLGEDEKRCNAGVGVRGNGRETDSKESSPSSPKSVLIVNGGHGQIKFECELEISQGDDNGYTNDVNCSSSHGDDVVLTNNSNLHPSHNHLEGVIGRQEGIISVSGSDVILKNSAESEIKEHVPVSNGNSYGKGFNLANEPNATTVSPLPPEQDVVRVSNFSELLDLLEQPVSTSSRSTNNLGNSSAVVEIKLEKEDNLQKSFNGKDEKFDCYSPRRNCDEKDEEDDMITLHYQQEEDLEFVKGGKKRRAKLDGSAQPTNHKRKRKGKKNDEKITEQETGESQKLSLVCPYPGCGMTGFESEGRLRGHQRFHLTYDSVHQQLSSNAESLQYYRVDANIEQGSIIPATPLNINITVKIGPSVDLIPGSRRLNLLSAPFAEFLHMNTYKCLICGEEGLQSLAELKSHWRKKHVRWAPTFEFNKEAVKPFGCGICGKPYFLREDAMVCSVLGHGASWLRGRMFNFRCPECIRHGGESEVVGFHSLAAVGRHWARNHAAESMPPHFCGIEVDDDEAFVASLPTSVRLSRIEVEEVKLHGPTSRRNKYEEEGDSCGCEKASCICGAGEIIEFPILGGMNGKNKSIIKPKARKHKDDRIINNCGTNQVFSINKESSTFILP